VVSNRGADFLLDLAALHLPEPTGVPKLVAEIPAKLDRPSHRKEYPGPGARCASCRSGGHRRHISQLNQRIRRIAELLRHFPPLFVPDDPGEINVTERQVHHELVPRNNHARYPEEHNVRGRDEVRGGWVGIF